MTAAALSAARNVGRFDSQRFWNDMGSSLWILLSLAAALTAWAARQRIQSAPFFEETLITPLTSRDQTDAVHGQIIRSVFVVVGLCLLTPRSDYMYTSLNTAILTGVIHYLCATVTVVWGVLRWGPFLGVLLSALTAALIILTLPLAIMVLALPVSLVSENFSIAVLIATVISGCATLAVTRLMWQGAWWTAAEEVYPPRGRDKLGEWHQEDHGLQVGRR